jgi:hypothetical protein
LLAAGTEVVLDVDGPLAVALEKNPAPSIPKTPRQTTVTIFTRMDFIKPSFNKVSLNAKSQLISISRS